MLSPTACEERQVAPAYGLSGALSVTALLSRSKVRSPIPVKGRKGAVVDRLEITKTILGDVA
jgi:hypothetical protein